jgi:hypothetical protein
MEDFAQRIKDSPIYDLYMMDRKQNRNKGDSALFLQAATMMFAIQDKELNHVMFQTAHALLFSMLDARFRSEIEKEGESQ